MKDYVKSYWKVILFFVVTGLIGGFFLGLYTLDSYPEAMQEELLSQGINQYVLGIVTAVQSAGYGLILGAIGILLSKKIGLWKDGILKEIGTIHSGISDEMKQDMSENPDKYFCQKGRSRTSHSF
mgnify:CR=1 FL=1